MEIEDQGNRIALIDPPLKQRAEQGESPLKRTLGWVSPVQGAFFCFSPLLQGRLAELLLLLSSAPLRLK